MAVYDGCGIVAIVYWLRLSPIYDCDSAGAIWGMACLVVVFAALLCVYVCVQ